MCGIAGIFHFKGQSVDPNQLSLLQQHLHHRGPNAGGTWIKDNIGLAHRRLSIVDLAETGNQPMLTEDGALVLVFNGEIYNYRELRHALVAKGNHFRGSSDTEVLLIGYRQWGIQNLLNRIEGMFAFVLVDHREKIAFAARDRFGKKPLYSALNQDSWYFSSELPGLNKVLPKLTPDFQALDYYLTELSVPQPQTIWKEVQQIRPGHCLELQLETGDYQEFPFWSLSTAERLDLSPEEALEALEEKLKKAIVKRTIGDVPIGTFLSGGVDSGLVTSLLAQHTIGKLDTFSVGFDYETYNELPLARALAQRYDTNHHEIVVEADIIKMMPQLVAHMGEPFADSSLIPSWLVCQEIAGKVKVALSGDGGDEVFGGYHEYGWAHQADLFLSRKQAPLAKAGSVLIGKGLHRLGLSAENPGNTQTYAEMPDALRLYRQMGFHPEQKTNLYQSDGPFSPHFAAQHLSQVWNCAQGHGIADKLFTASLKTRLLNDYLVKVDRSSMAHSLEVRSPFLDVELMEWSRQVDNRIHLHKGTPKYLLKKLAQKHVDPEILKRKKQGFGMPLHHWLRHDLKTFVQEQLIGDGLLIGDWLKPQAVQQVVDEHLKGTQDHTNRIWALLCLYEWRRQYLHP
ncbi:MAG: asparagine synthase (glutamine-hydrolyzing) [Salibacteraceae bacterium]